MQDRKNLTWWTGLILGLGSALVLWFLPGLRGLSAAAQHGLALMVATVIFWVFRVADEAVTALLFMAAVISLKVMPANTFLADWTGPNIWFAISAFILGEAVAKSGLVRRITYALLLRVPNSFAALTGIIFVIQAAFTFFGVAGSFARIALLYPLITEIAEASGLSREGNAFKGLAIAVMASGEPAMLLSLTGFWLNPFAMKLAGSDFLYSDWLRYFTVPALFLLVLTWLTVMAVFPSRGRLAIPREDLKARLADLGSFWGSKREVRTVAYLLFILVLWLTDFRHGINPGWIALLGACLLMFPRIGVLDFKPALGSVRWGIVLFLGAAFSLGKMVQALGLNEWLGALVLPDNPPQSATGLAALVAYISMGLHLLTGDVASSMSVTVPTLSAYAGSFGFSPAVFAFIAYVASWEQYLFPFQNAGVLMAYGYGYFTAKDLLKFGLALTVVIPLGLLLFALPYWQAIGVM